MAFPAVTPYDVSRRAGKRHTANDAHITARKVIKLQPVDIGIETFLEHQNQHRTHVTDEIQRDNEEAHVAFYPETSDETLEEKSLETQIDGIEAQEKPKRDGQIPSLLIEGHTAQHGTAASNQGQQKTENLDVALHHRHGREQYEDHQSDRSVDLGKSP